MLPARGTSARDDSLLAHRDFSRVRARIDASYEASRDYLDERAREAAVIWLLRRCVIAPAMIAAGGRLVGPAPALADRRGRAGRRCCPAGWRLLRILWLTVV